MLAFASPPAMRHHSVACCRRPNPKVVAQYRRQRLRHHASHGTFRPPTGMKEREALLYMSSVAGLATPVPGNSAYDISKLVDLQLAAFAALENLNVTAIAFYPGIITDLHCRRCRFLPSFREGHTRIGWRGYQLGNPPAGTASKWRLCDCKLGCDAAASKEGGNFRKEPADNQLGWNNWADC